MLVRTGEKILQLHMTTQHSPNSLRTVTPEQLATINRENDILIARATLVLGGALAILGLGLALEGYGVNGTLTCIPFSVGCYIPQSIVGQIATSSFAVVYVGAQESVYGGLLLFTFGSMGVAYWVTQKLVLVPRLQIVLLVRIFLLVLVTALSIAGGIIPFGERIIPPTL